MFTLLVTEMLFLLIRGLIFFGFSKPRLNPFPHTTNLQQTTLKTYLHKLEQEALKVT